MYLAMPSWWLRCDPGQRDKVFLVSKVLPSNAVAGAAPSPHARRSLKR